MSILKSVWRMNIGDVVPSDLGEYLILSCGKQRATRGRKVDWVIINPLDGEFLVTGLILPPTKPTAHARPSMSVLGVNITTIVGLLPFTRALTPLLLVSVIIALYATAKDTDWRLSNEYCIPT